MKRLLVFALLVFFSSLGSVRNLAAQDLVINNARIIVGNGNVINQGSIVIRGGKLASVSAAAANVPGVQTIDARGMTAMPGFIEGHGHFVGPSHMQISPLHHRPLKIDCPIAWESPDGQVGEATLRFWCERPKGNRHLGVERLASRIEPAVQQWLYDNASTIATPRPAERRISGPVERRSVTGGPVEV